MKETIETRELIVLPGLDVIVRGTYHKTRYDSSAAQSSIAEKDRVGVVFLNSLSPTRAANGDSSVYWADSFAEHGYPSFRLDLPGFGDSDGDTPTELLSYINAGGYASVASAKVTELMERFSLSGVILVGLCAGAVSALYTAADTQGCQGLVLLDPYFFLPLVTNLNVWQRFANRISQSALGGLINSMSDRWRALRVLLFGAAPPSNANFPLLNCWKKVASTGLPILVFKAPHSPLKMGGFDYLSYLLDLAGSRSQVAVQVIEGTDHSFSDRVGRSAVRRHSESWLDASFPRTKRREVAGSVLYSESNDDTVCNPVSRMACTANICPGV